MWNLVAIIHPCPCWLTNELLHPPIVSKNYLLPWLMATNVIAVNTIVYTNVLWSWFHWRAPDDVSLSVCFWFSSVCSLFADEGSSFFSDSWCTNFPEWPRWIMENTHTNYTHTNYTQEMRKGICILVQDVIKNCTHNNDPRPEALPCLWPIATLSGQACIMI